MTADVWKDGRLVMVTGKVRSRSDQMSLSCDSAIEYDPENPTPLPAPVPVKAWNGHKNNGKGFNGNDNGHKGNINGSKLTDHNASEKKGQMTIGNSIPAEPQKVVRLVVTESEDPSHDAHLLREVIGVLLEYPGRDRVNLDIRTSERLVRMDLPVVSTGYCEGLHSRLEELLGSDTVAVHQELGLGIESPAEESVTMPLETASIITAESVPAAAVVPAENEPIGTAQDPVAVSGSGSFEMPSETPTIEEPIAVAAEASVGVPAEAAGDEPPF